jgi:hypothetical protein
MIANITSMPTPHASGWQVYVRLSLNDEEHTLVYENRMSLSDEGLEVAEYDGQNLFFGAFYGRTHTTVWDFDSAYQAGLFVEQLNRVLNGGPTLRGSVNWFLAQNRKKPGQKDIVPWNFFDE